MKMLEVHPKQLCLTTGIWATLWEFCSAWEGENGSGGDLFVFAIFQIYCEWEPNNRAFSHVPYWRHKAGRWRFISYQSYGEGLEEFQISKRPKFLCGKHALWALHLVVKYGSSVLWKIQFPVHLCYASNHRPQLRVCHPQRIMLLHLRKAVPHMWLFE